MRIREIEAVSLEKGPDQLGVTFQEFVEHLAVVDVVASLRSHGGWSIVKQLVFLDSLDVHLLVECLIRSCIYVGGWI